MSRANEDQKKSCLQPGGDDNLIPNLFKLLSRQVRISPTSGKLPVIIADKTITLAPWPLSFLIIAGIFKSIKTLGARVIQKVGKISRIQN